MINKKMADKIVKPIIKALENGELPPWKSGLSRKVMMGNMPRNIITNRHYSGGNVFALLVSGYDSPLWGTKNNMKKLGAWIKKEEFSNPVTVFFWKRTFRKVVVEVEGDDGQVETETKEKSSFYLQTYEVYNLEQTDLDPAKYADIKPANTPAEACEEADKVMNAYLERDKNLTLSYKICTPCYRPLSDEINLPELSVFKQSERYYEALFHEAGHSTGHGSRLNRDLSGWKGFEKYSKEELVAEMAAALLCGHCGMFSPELTENAAAYIKSWMRKLKGEPQLLIYAGSQAQKAANWVLTGKAYNK